MNAAMNRNLFPGSDRHDETMVGDGCVRLSSVLHGRDDVERIPGSGANGHAEYGAGARLAEEDSEQNEGGWQDRLMTFGLPLFAWAALGVAFLLI